MARDKVHLKDSASAVISRVRTEPKHPCMKCGSETKPLPIEVLVCTDRICSAPSCRKVQPAIEEVPRRSVNDEAPRFPCRDCGKETKAMPPKEQASETGRICVRCKHEEYPN